MKCVEVWYSFEKDILVVVDEAGIHKYMGDLCEDPILRAFETSKNEWYIGDFKPNHEMGYELVGLL